MWCNVDSDGEETVSANHLSGPQFSAQAQYHVNYEDAVIDNKLEEKDKSEDLGISTCIQPCTTDKTVKSDVDLIACAITPNHLGKKKFIHKILFKSTTKNAV